MPPDPGRPEGDASAPDPQPSAGGAGFDFADPRSPLARFYLQASHLVAVALLGLLFVFFSLMIPLEHTDSWGHLAYGRWMVERGQLPAHEPFSSFSDQKAPYVNFQWLTQLGGYLVYRGGELLAGGDAVRQTEGGVQMLRAAHAVVTVLRFLVLLLAFRRLCGSLPLACVGIVVVLLFSLGPSSVQRPQAVGELLFACLLLPLARPVLSGRALILIPLVVALWANCHGSFLIGLALLGVFLAGRVVEVMREAGSWNPLRALGDPQVRRLALVLGLSAVAAGLLNPHGPALYLDVLSMSRHPNLRTIEEWLPLDFTLDSGGGHWGYLGLLVLLAASQALSPQALTPTQVLLLVTFGVLPLFQQRMILWWVMVVPLLLLPLWVAIGKQLTWSWLLYQSVPDLRKTILAVLLVVVAFLWSGPAHWLTTGSPQPLRQAVVPGTPWKLAVQFQTAPGQRPTMPALARALAQNYPEGRFTGRTMTSEGAGDYLLVALPDRTKLLTYTHAHLFPREHWLDYLTALLGEPGWQDVLDRHQVNLVVIEAAWRKDLAQQLRQAPDWEIVLDEIGDESLGGTRGRLLIALRKRPLGLAGQKSEVRGQRSGRAAGFIPAGTSPAAR